MKARASLNPYRDEVYTETLAALEEKLKTFHTDQVECDPALNATLVELTKTTYAAGNGAVDARRAHEMKPATLSPLHHVSQTMQEKSQNYKRECGSSAENGEKEYMRTQQL